MNRIPYKNPWTCKIIIHYHRCPSCGFIQESREDFHIQNNHLQKKIQCIRCGENFIIVKEKKPNAVRPY
jgi:hypothetical protein